jgi:hypothetical protein
MIPENTSVLNPPKLSAVNTYDSSMHRHVDMKIALMILPDFFVQRFTFSKSHRVDSVNMSANTEPYQVERR